MAQGQPRKKVANSLVAMSSAAILAVYSAGYTRTRSAARRLEAQAIERRLPAAAPAASAPPLTKPAPQPVEVPVHKASITKSPGNTAPTPVEPAPENALPAPAAVDPPAVAPAPAAPLADLPAPVAPAPPPSAPPPAPATPAWKDGTYLGWGSSRHGDIQAAVVIEAGRIASATIAQCLTRYSCSVISRLPPEVAERQSPEVDYVSGATQSANAFYYAVVDALSKAK